MYLVLRVCRACNHRGTAKRPSTPSHSASRHSIFFSPRPRFMLFRPPRSAGAPLFPGPDRPLAPRDHASFSPLRRSTLSPALRRVTLMRPFCNHYRSSQLDRGCATSFPLSFLRPFVSLVRACLSTHLSLAPRISLLSITDRPMKRIRATRRAPIFSSVFSCHAEIYYRDARLILDLARILRLHVRIHIEFSIGTVRSRSSPQLY